MADGSRWLSPRAEGVWLQSRTKSRPYWIGPPARECRLPSAFPESRRLLCPGIEPANSLPNSEAERRAFRTRFASHGCSSAAVCRLPRLEPETCRAVEVRQATTAAFHHPCPRYEGAGSASAASRQAFARGPDSSSPDQVLKAAPPSSLQHTCLPTSPTGHAEWYRHVASDVRNGWQWHSRLRWRLEGFAIPLRMKHRPERWSARNC